MPKISNELMESRSKTPKPVRDLIRKWDEEKKPIAEIVENKSPDSITEMLARAYVLNVLESTPGSNANISATDKLTEMLDGKSTPDDVIQRAQVVLMDERYETEDGVTRRQSVSQHLPGIVVPGLGE